jgi:probable rRNA maturation factor
MASRVAVEFGEGARAALRAELGEEGPRDATAWIKRGVKGALRATGHEEAQLSVVLLGDAAIADLNERYLEHSGPTDVLSFPLSHEDGGGALGEVYIGVEQAKRQADLLDIALREELIRLAVHGTLHVLGHDHPEGDEREASPMWVLQERIVAEVAST